MKSVFIFLIGFLFVIECYTFKISNKTSKKNELQVTQDKPMEAIINAQGIDASDQVLQTSLFRSKRACVVGLPQVRPAHCGITGCVNECMFSDSIGKIHSQSIMKKILTKLQ